MLQTGNAIESKLAERTKDGRPVHRLETLLAEGPARTEQRFRSLKHLAKKGKVPDSGVW